MQKNYKKLLSELLRKHYKVPLTAPIATELIVFILGKIANAQLSVPPYPTKSSLLVTLM